MKIREITTDDVPELFRVRIATWHNQHGEAELTRMGITHESVSEMLETGTHRGWLCEVEGEVIGFAMGDRTDGEMWVIAVLKQHENRGIGRQLLTAVEDWLWSEGWDTIWLTTDTSDDFRAVGFYKHLGWVDWKLEADRYMRKHRPQTAV